MGTYMISITIIIDFVYLYTLFMAFFMFECVFVMAIRYSWSDINVFNVPNNNV